MCKMNFWAEMEKLRSEGWLVLIKALPDNLPWVIPGNCSEFDAPCPDKLIERGKWAVEISWMRRKGYRSPHDAFGDSPQEALARLLRQKEVHDANLSREPKAVS